MKLHATRLTLACLVVLGTALPALTAQAQETSAKSPLAGRAVAILCTHCFECHGQGAKPARANLTILDDDLLKKRGLVFPGRPNQSEFIDLIDSGAMPPGTRRKLSVEERQTLRDWITQNAPPFASGSDDYILRSIREDVGKLGVEQKKTARYFSLHHLLMDAKASQDLDNQRDALKKAVAYLSRGKADGLTGIESTNTVFRVDLGELGWDEQPFVEMENHKTPFLDKDGKPKQSKVNRFDLILLEYPYATIDPSSELFQHLATEFLRPADPVRPIIYVRGDWFAAVAVPLLARDFGKDGGAFTVITKEWPVTVPTAGVPVPPLDALSVLNYPLTRLPFEVDFKARTFPKDAVTTVFKQNEMMKIAIKPNVEVFIKLAWTYPNQQKIVVDVGLDNHLKANELGLYGPNGGWPMEELGKDLFTVVAYSGEHPLPKTHLLRAKGIRDRIVHEFCTYPRDGGPIKLLFNPGKVVKRTLEIETVK